MKLWEKIQNDDVYFIAEMSANHTGKLENALSIVREAKQAGADCVKIQTYTADTITLNSDKEYFRLHDGAWKGYTLYQLYKEAYTPWEWTKDIKAECDRLDIDFLSTPFDVTAVDFLEGFNVGAYKIATCELVHIPLIEYAASKGKPMIISTGMGSDDDIFDAVEACRSVGNDKIILLKCTCEYPADFSDMNLLNMTTYTDKFGVHYGLSDHTLGLFGGAIAPITAVTLGARIIEKHICLSRKADGPDSFFSMEVREFADMVSAVKLAKATLGEIDRTISEKERKTAYECRRSIFTSSRIRKGEKFTSDNIKIVRPANGLLPKLWKEIIGKTAIRDIDFAEPLKEGDYE